MIFPPRIESQLFNNQLVVPDDPTIPYIEGDGIGKEVMNEVLNVIDWMAKKKSVFFNSLVYLFRKSKMR